ncbi:hypothetical protein SAMN05216332_10927 [Nitrosospira briensis]|nr:hypothetical protein SAMN05216332_10927 [Nitrosospira briensis]
MATVTIITVTTAITMGATIIITMVMDTIITMEVMEDMDWL